MKPLPDQFPSKEPSEDHLLAIARRAREQFAAQQSLQENNRPAQPQRCSSRRTTPIASARRDDRLGLLDVAALIAISALTAIVFQALDPTLAQISEVGTDPLAMRIAAGEGTVESEHRPPEPPEPRPGDGLKWPRSESFLQVRYAEHDATHYAQMRRDMDEMLQLAMRRGLVDVSIDAPVVPKAASMDIIDLLETRTTQFSQPRNQPVFSPFALRTGAARRLMSKRYGGNKASENAVDLSLRWLAFHQEPDGRYDAAKWGGQKVDTTVTALVLLVYLGAGHTEKVGKYRDNVLRAVDWLISKQQKNGRIANDEGDAVERAIGDPHSIATIALAEAAATARIPKTIAAAQLAVNFCVDSQHKGGGWLYRTEERGDLAITAWYVAALRTAKSAGLQVPHQTLEKAVAFLDGIQVTNDDGTTSYRPLPHEKIHHRSSAMGHLCRMKLGSRAADHRDSIGAWMKQGGLPIWGENGGSVDLLHWFYGTQAVFQVGGEEWLTWNAALRNTLVENQCQAGDDSGSWNPVGELSSQWGRAGQTALAALCLQTYYRVLRVEDTRAVHFEVRRAASGRCAPMGPEHNRNIAPQPVPAQRPEPEIQPPADLDF